MKLSFAYSPCPNDTFMFEPIVNKRINTRGIEFDIILDEVEQLNQSAQKNQYDISKMSFNAFTKLTDGYQLLNSGSALGRNCGPLLISKIPMTIDDLSDKLVAIPGYNTTANLLMNIALPQVTNKIEIVFSDIEEAILSGKVDAGLIIHESRFTYAEKGLHKVIDMGEYWEETTQSPIPLGGIAVKRELDEDVKRRINQVLHESIAYAFAHPKSGLDYIKQHSQEMEEEVMYKHIDLYVNDFSQDLGKEGKRSIQHLFDYLVKRGEIDEVPENIFIS